MGMTVINIYVNVYFFIINKRMSNIPDFFGGAELLAKNLMKYCRESAAKTHG
jgi:hypothetical protein